MTCSDTEGVYSGLAVPGFDILVPGLDLKFPEQQSVPLYCGRGCNCSSAVCDSLRLGKQDVLRLMVTA